MGNEYEISPSAKLDFGNDWVKDGWLGTVETISASTWTVTGGLTLSLPANVSGVTSTFVEGAVLGQSYVLSNTVTTNQGRIDTRVIKLSCKIR